MKAQLTNFVIGLFKEGEVVVSPIMVPIEEEDYFDTLYQVKQFYDQDKLRMPLGIPDFSRAAAMWAVVYFYRATQLVLLRNLGEEAIEEHLTDFSEQITAENIYSIDLVFRYLPDLFQLAKSLAPADLLVKKLIATATKYPFSSVTIDLSTAANHELILDNPTLRRIYIDRIILAKDKKRVEDNELQEWVREAIGEHQKTIWPALNLSPEHHNIRNDKKI